MKELLVIINEYWFAITTAWVFLYLIIKASNIWLDYIRRKSEWWYWDVEVDLSSHQFFTDTEHHINVRIPNLPIANDFKREVFRDLLTLKYEHFRDSLYEFVKRKDIDIMTKNKLYSEMKKIFDNTTNKCLKEADDKWIPKVAIDKFMTWHSWTIEATSRIIKEFIYSEYFYTNTSRVSAILSAYNVEFLLTLSDAEKTINSLNWELLNLTYKGILCQSH